MSDRIARWFFAIFVLAAPAYGAPPGKAPIAATATASRPASAATPSEPLVDLQRGTLPIVLSAPHGGLEEVPGVPPRTNRPANPPPGTPRWVTGTDVNTRVLAQKIARELQLRLGGTPYFVFARFHRKYIDANRAPDDSYEVEAAKLHYEAYQNALARFCGEVRKKHGVGLMIDVHGQASFKDEILVGTVGGKTGKLLVERQGVEALVGREGIVGYLIDAGLKPKPELNSANLNVAAGLNGGFNVQTYGSHRPGGIDAVQFEYGSNYRTKENLDDTARRTAEAIETFYRTYLSKHRPTAAKP